MINPASHQPRQPLRRGALSRPPNQPPRPHEKITHRRQMSMKSKIQTPRPRSQTALSQTQRSRHSRPHQFTNILSSTHSCSASGNLDQTNATAPAVMGAEKDVPQTDSVPPPTSVVLMASPGAQRSTVSPAVAQQEKLSFCPVALTEMT